MTKAPSNPLSLQDPLQSIQALVSGQGDNSDGHLERPAKESRGGEQTEDSIREISVSTLRIKNN